MSWDIILPRQYQFEMLSTTITKSKPKIRLLREEKRRMSAQKQEIYSAAYCIWFGLLCFEFGIRNACVI